MKYLGWILFILFATVIGFYPALYWTTDMHAGFLSTKPESLLRNNFWHSAFYTHLTFGGLSLLTGWSQFSEWMRRKNIGFHRWLGKLYVLSVFVSGLAALYIAFYATGGLISSLGFGGLAIAWLSATFLAYQNIRRRNIENHHAWMIRSYALTFAAVTLRLWIPLFQILAPFDFVTSYKIIAWLCWIPNLVIAEWIINVRSIGASNRDIIN